MISFPSSLFTTGFHVNTPEINLVREAQFLAEEQTVDNKVRYNTTLHGMRDIIQTKNSSTHTTIGNRTKQFNYVIDSLEDPMNVAPAVILNQMNTYTINPYSVFNFHAKYKDDAGNEHNSVLYQSVVPSMFSSHHSVNVNGMTENIPLINIDRNSVMPVLTPIGQPVTKDKEGNFSYGTYGTDANGKQSDTRVNNDFKDFNVDTTNCSIKKLVELSQKAENGNGGYPSELGRARYKYADFMYCAELGKIANNQLITLRRFSLPVGDDIFKNAVQSSDDSPLKQPVDVARMVTWFGTEENKLENILKYKYQATWKNLESKREVLQNAQSQNDESMISVLANSTSPEYVKALINGFTRSNNVIGVLGKAMGFDVLATDGPHGHMLGFTDNNKVYTPQDTVQDTHIYEGKLVFEQNILLTFNYKLRAYNNINPRAAFLDLIGNVLTCTYRKGKFWGGSRPVAGPTQNRNTWFTANKIIDESVDALGGVISSLFNGGGYNLGPILGDICKNVKQIGKDIVEGVKSNGKGDTFAGALELLKGLLKNKLGRPLMYATDSLLTGADVGFWHLTIGNPRNPIAVIGNLILTDTTITHKGPLGIDDFPTELKVVCNLKPGRSRDKLEIEKMYNKGLKSIYQDYGDLVEAGHPIPTWSRGNEQHDLSEIYGDANIGLVKRTIVEMG